MQICLFRRGDGASAIGFVEDGKVYDLTAYDSARFGSFSDLISSASPAATIASCAAELTCHPGVSLKELDVAPGPGRAHLLAPMTTQEVWGAGVTYLRSRDARMEESVGGGSFYDRVYEAVRPELFFKATAARVSGPNAPVRIRGDSRWTVPEPELVLVINSRAEIVGYTIGNDMSARDIEGENPLYLPQAKIYAGCCALGPLITLATDALPVRDWDIRLTIRRAGETCFQGATTLDKMKRNFGELAAYLFREQAFPDGVFLLTGTGIVPPDDLSLCPGDVVEITVSGIGTLRNPCCGSPQR